MLTNSAGSSGIDAQRVQILKRMGIDVWHLRPSRGELAVLPASTPVAPESPARPPSAQVEGTGPQLTAAPVAPNASPPQEAAQQSEPEPVERFELLCIRAPGALLFSPPLAAVPHRRLAQDIALSVQVAHRQSGGAAEFVEFRYPQIESTVQGNWQGALKAFTSKQQGLVGSQLVLATHEVAGRFAGWLDDQLLPMPEVAELAGSAELKQALWQQIRSRLSR